jgi:hypothetical protein
MDRVIVCKFCKQEYFNPIILIVIYVGVKVMFKDLILVFYLTVHLQIVGRV